MTRSYRHTMASNPLKVFGMAPLGMKMFSKGRLGIFPKSIKGKAQLAKILKSALEEQEKEPAEKKEEGH